MLSQRNKLARKMVVYVYMAVLMAYNARHIYVYMVACICICLILDVRHYSFIATKHMLIMMSVTHEDATSRLFQKKRRCNKQIV
jgi:hypothetical protein